jgi:parvulin-like peptidyl-prolyl isomerase
VLAEARARDPRDFGAFADLARQKTEDPAARAVGGDLHFLSKDELTKRAGAEVAEAAFALKEVGKVSEQIVETPQGFYLLKLLGRENALNLKLDDVREAIKNRLLYDRRSQNYQKFLTDLEKQAGLAVDAKLLDTLQVEVGPGLPPPGSIPQAPMQRTTDQMPREAKP